MINPSDGQGMGYMVVGLSQKLLGKSFVMGNESFDSSNFMVVDEDDQLVYFVGNEEGRMQLCNPILIRERTICICFLLSPILLQAGIL